MLGLRSTASRWFRVRFWLQSNAGNIVPLDNTKNQTPECSGVWQLKQLAVSQINLSSFDNFTGFYAACADLHPAVAAGRQLDADRLKIRVEPPSRFIVSV